MSNALRQIIWVMSWPLRIIGDLLIAKAVAEGMRDEGDMPYPYQG